MTTNLFVKRALSLRVPSAPPRAVAVAAPVVVPIPASYAPPPYVATPVSPQPKKPDVEDVRLGFAFGMQEVRIGLHATSEAAAKFGASLVGGR